MSNLETTYDSLLKLTGERYQDSTDIELLCSALDGLTCRDLLNILTALGTVRSKTAPVQETISGNRFHEESTVDQRYFHLIDELLLQAFPTIPFIELSPVQPFGLNTTLADIGANNILSTLRRSEVTADITTALFRVAYNRLQSNSSISEVRLAGNARITRTPQFEKNTKFLPHFRMFGEVTVGREKDISNPDLGPNETVALMRHFTEEIDFLDTIIKDQRFDLHSIKIELGNVGIMRTLIQQGKVDTATINKRTIDPNYMVFEDFGIDLPHQASLEEIVQRLDSTGIVIGLKGLEAFLILLKQIRPDLLPRIVFDVDRIAGSGYYKSVCYKITGVTSNEELVPLVDGGTTLWGKKFSGNKRTYSVSSGLGTELLAQYFIKQPGSTVESK